MDAKTLYRQGVIAIRDQNDPVRGRALLLESLEGDPHNDMAWLWLTRTTSDRATRIEYLERALRINPDNAQARRLRDRLGGPSPDQPAPSPAIPPAAVVPAAEAPHSVIRPLVPYTVAKPVTPQERDRIAYLMDRGEIYREAGDIEQAVAQWIEVLQIRVDHEIALRNAAGHLWQLGYRDDARELVQRAIDARSAVPTVYLTAIDMAERVGDYDAANAVRERLVAQPDSDDQLIVKIAEFYAGRYQMDQAIPFLERAAATHPTSQPILVKLGDLLEESGRPRDAQQVYDQAASLGTRSKAGKEANKRLDTFVPVLTDRERGSVWLAVRETLGIVLLYLFLGWQDARLSLLHMGLRHWVGIVLSLVGGYLLITATSSPQQDPVAGWLGGEIPPTPPQPEPGEPLVRAPGRALQDPSSLPLLASGARAALGLAGGLLLVLALVLVLNQSLDWVFTHKPPYLPW